MVSEIIGERMVLCEYMQANVLIEKLPSPSWDEYKKHLRNTGTNKRSYDQYNKPQNADKSIKTMTENCWWCDKPGHPAFKCKAKKAYESYRHICTNKDLYKEFKDVDEKEVVYVGNSSKVQVLGIGKVHLKLTSGKVLALENVLYVPDMRRNLISGTLLNKAGLKLTFESDKLVMSKNGQFACKGFCNGDLFVLDVEMNASTSSAYIVESIYI
ncbi:uncharacterized protein LOC141645888 [Silene latifolia]|uniref:uncharacterized protein LOC141645888 n=1 Tax=Silene latifolia TaxID=37657 RepID=UPI003D77F6F6